VLPVPHTPDALTITPATKVRQGPQGTEVIMPDKRKVERAFRYVRQDFFVGRTRRPRRRSATSSTRSPTKTGKTG